MCKETDTDTSPALPEAVQGTCRFLALPLEIRMKVYEYLLISPRPLSFLDDRKVNRPMVFSVPYGLKPDIDATFMRTCQAVYREALPVLYQRNTFEFDGPGGITHFKDANLPFLGKSIPGASCIPSIQSPILVVCIV